MTIKDVKQHMDGSLFIEFTDEEMAEVGWKPGDTIQWKDNGDGSWTMSKKEETEFVLVECVATHRMRYCVEVPKGKADWALDTVAMGEAKEFSQQYLGENIISHRVVTQEEAIKQARIDNDYIETWSDDYIFETFVTTQADLET